jgi:hypothetical protein
MHIQTILVTLVATSITVALAAPAAVKDAEDALRIDFFTWAMAQDEISYADLKGQLTTGPYKKLAKDRITVDSINFAKALLEKEAGIANQLEATFAPGTPGFTFRDYFHNHQEPKIDFVGMTERQQQVARMQLLMKAIHGETFYNDTLVDDAIRETLTTKKPFMNRYLLDPSPENIYAVDANSEVQALMETTIPRAVFKKALKNENLLPMVNVYRHRYADASRYGIKKDLEYKESADCWMAGCCLLPCLWPCLPIGCVISASVNKVYKISESGSLLVHLAIGLLGVMSNDVVPGESEIVVHS